MGNAVIEKGSERGEHTMQSHNTENENEGEDKNNDGIDFQSWGFIGVEFCFLC